MVSSPIPHHPLNPLEYHQMILLSGECYEPEVTNFISSALQEGMTFFDVGAALGYYTLWRSRSASNTETSADI